MGDEFYLGVCICVAAASQGWVAQTSSFEFTFDQYSVPQLLKFGVILTFIIGGITRNEYWKMKGPHVVEDPAKVLDFDSQAEVAGAGYWPRPKRIIDSALDIEN